MKKVLLIAFAVLICLGLSSTLTIAEEPVAISSETTVGSLFLGKDKIDSTLNHEGDVLQPETL